MGEGLKQQRKHIRTLIALAVKYSVAADPNRVVKETTIDNISEGGISISSDNSIPVSTVLDLDIGVPRVSGSIKAKGKVVRVEEIKEDKLYKIGISFTEIEAKDIDFIRQCTKSASLDKILDSAVTNGASEVHLAAGQPILMRLAGTMQEIEKEVFGAEEIKYLIYSFLTDEEKGEFGNSRKVDTFYQSNLGYFRASIYQEKGHIAAVFKHIPSEIKTFEELGLPKITQDLCRSVSGLIIVTGPKGSGKSATLAAMINFINEERSAVIVSLESPIEYFYHAQKSVIYQRELGLDVSSFDEAINQALRQGANVIFIGEVRDMHSIYMALTAAESGHLVLISMHTPDVVSTIERMIGIFPAEQQQQIKTLLAGTLRGIIVQRLIPRKDGQGQALAVEVAVGTPAVADIIRQGNIKDIINVMQAGSQDGMCTMDSSLQRLNGI